MMELKSVAIHEIKKQDKVTEAEEYITEQYLDKDIKPKNLTWLTVVD